MARIDLEHFSLQKKGLQDDTDTKKSQKTWVSHLPRSSETKGSKGHARGSRTEQKRYSPKRCADWLRCPRKLKLHLDFVRNVTCIKFVLNDCPCALLQLREGQKTVGDTG